MFDPGKDLRNTANPGMLTAIAGSFTNRGNEEEMLVRVVVDTAEGHVLIRAAGELDVSSAARLQRTGEDALADGHDVVLLDLSGILFLDSTGLGVLTALHRSGVAHDAHVAVVAASAAVRRVVELMGARHVLALHETVADALSHR